MPAKNFTFDELLDLAGGSVGTFDVACPLCGPEAKSQINRNRKVLRVWYNGGEMISFRCARCEEKGFAKDDGAAKHERPPRRAPLPPKDRSKLAYDLWDRAGPIISTPAEIYLRQRQCFINSPNLRFLYGDGRYHHAMIARFASKDGSTKAIHMTRITDAGRKADTETVKIMLGKSQGWPIIVVPNNGDTLCLAEGIEDAISMALALNVGGVLSAAWAAGSAGRIAPCLKRAKHYDKIVVAVDDDAAGKRALAAARAVRSDLLAVKFRRGSDVMDANAMLIRFGVDAVWGCIARAKSYQIPTHTWRRPDAQKPAR